MLQPQDMLGAIVAPPYGRNRRISSNEQPNWNNGNIDLTRLAPGEEFTLPILKGPGYINHIWFTSHAGGVGELNALSMRIYWDDREEPGVEVPVGDFFACGQRPTTVESIPVQVSETGALSCYWRMPFNKSARIVITNDNPDRGTGLYWQVDYVELPEPLPADTPYFHARYRQEYPAVMGRDYQIANIEGAGRYVGTVMSVTMAQDGWWGEGDDYFYIDGEEVPSIQGTGSEDYFNDAWGFRPRTSNWFGQSWWTGWAAGDWGVCYRWHIPDSVSFTKSLKVEIEHKGNADPPYDAWYMERPDFLSSVAFWYHVGEPKNLMGHLPPWHERRVPWHNIHLVHSFRQIQATGDAKPGIDTTGLFGARPMITWPNESKDASISVPFRTDESGRFAVRLAAFQAPGYGAYDVILDGQVLREAVRFGVGATEGFESGQAALFQSASGGATDVNLGVHELASGYHTLTLKCVAPGGLGVEMLGLLKLPPPAVREVKGENERGYIRSGIGSAVYAHRLVTGEVPESLEQLVELGMLGERYLMDENMYPFRSRREGDALVIESTSPSAWTASWTGADARR